MKKTLKLSFAILALGLIFTTSSCKYEEGPKFSLRTKKARLAGDWTIEKTEDKNGNVSTWNQSEKDALTITFEKDGKYKSSFSSSGFTSSAEGEWEFTDGKEKLKITVAGDSDTETIILLKNKEFGLEDSDGDKTYYIAK